MRKVRRDSASRMVKRALLRKKWTDNHPYTYGHSYVSHIRSRLKIDALQAPVFQGKSRWTEHDGSLRNLMKSRDHAEHYLQTWGNSGPLGRSKSIYPGRKNALMQIRNFTMQLLLRFTRSERSDLHEFAWRRGIFGRLRISIVMNP